MGTRKSPEIKSRFLKTKTVWDGRRVQGVGCRVDVRLPGNGNSNSHGARLVHLIITMIKWIQTSRLSIRNSLSLQSHDRFAGGIPQKFNDGFGKPKPYGMATGFRVLGVGSQLLRRNVKRFR